MGYDVGYAAALDDDLDALHESNPDAAALWLQVVGEIWDIEAVRAELARNRGFRKQQPMFDTIFIVQLLELRYNVGRVKLYVPAEGLLAPLAPLPQRLLYAIDERVSSNSDGKVWLLGLMPRYVDYDPTSAFVRRICADYDAIGIPRLPARC